MYRPQENPCRRSLGGQSPRESRGQAVAAIPARRLAGQGGVRESRPVENGDRHARHQIPPAVPARQLEQVVGADDPHEAHLRINPAQVPHRIVASVAREAGFQVAHTNAPMLGASLGAGHSLRQGRHVGGRFQRVLRRYEPPHLVKRQPAQRQQTNTAMPVVGGVERPAEKADAEADAEAGARRMRGASCADLVVTRVHLSPTEFRGGPARCRARRICRWLAAQAHKGRGRADARSRCRFRRPCRTHRRRRIALRHCA